MKLGLVLIALALASTLAACTPEALVSPGSDEATGKKVTDSPVKAPKISVGDTATTTGKGNTLTVVSYESPVSLKGLKPRQNSEFSIVEVKGCASSSSETELMYVGSNAFTLRLPDGTTIQPEDLREKSMVKEPALHTMDLRPGECDRGFVTFQVPKDREPDAVVFDEQFESQPDISWKIPSRQ